MRLKLFAAPTREEAIAAIHAELGLDAIVLSEMETDDGYEVRAAVERPGTVKFPTPTFTPKPRTDSESGLIRNRLRDILIWHGAPDGFASVLANSGARLVGDGAGDPAAAFSAALDGAIGFSPIQARPDQSVMLVGPPGAGKTATAAKLVRRAAAADVRLDAICADFDATSAAAQLAAYLQRPIETLQAAMTPMDLAEMMAPIRAEGGVTIIDTPPINPFDTEDLDRLKDLIRMIDAEPVLVMSAEGHPADLEDAVRAFSALGIRRCVLTKLDAVRRRGGAISALASAKLSLSHLALTPFIGGGLVPATPNRLARLLIDDAPGAEALKGAA